VCTVVVRWEPGEPVRMLALRDELVGRAFDDPGAWWPSHPQLIGGRDRLAGGTWCVSDITAGSTCVVLNRPQRRLAAPGAPSRGVLPLAVAERGESWSEGMPLDGMASFALAWVTPERLSVWEYDGQRLARHDLSPGTHMLTSGGAEDGRERRHLDRFVDADFPAGWLAIATEQPPSADLSALVVRVEHEDAVYATVFGQLIESSPGRLELSWSREPGGGAAWTSGSWTA
jgi:hypothetical protein